MSRSIHETRRDLSEAVRDGADAERVKHLRAQLATKRRIKEQALEGQRSPADESGSVEAIPVCVRDTGPYLHYPASVEDVRAVMQLLPKGALDGLATVELCSGITYQRGLAKTHTYSAPDPHVGRHGYETLPGVFVGRTLGTYWSIRQRIRVYAYVYDGAKTDGRLWDVYLRLNMLATFIHEAAHHYDHSKRVARGRWRADSTAKAEMYAKDFEHEWVQQYVVPYLQQTYSKQWQELDAWITHHGGCSISLMTLAGEPRTMNKQGRVSRVQGGVFSVEGALESLCRHVAEGMPLTDTRLWFAEELHWAEYYTEALAIIERVLHECPGNSRALTLKADILVHLKNYDAAFLCLKQLLHGDRDNAIALQILADVYEARQEWPELRRVTTTLLDRLNVSDNAREAELLLQRAQARVELGDLTGAKADLSWLRDERRKWIQRRVKQLRTRIEAQKRQDCNQSGRTVSHQVKSDRKKKSA